MTDEAIEGRDAFLEKRPPDWTPFPYYYELPPTADLSESQLAIAR
jgi:hypothetical protein